jgi:hypothetical protein
MALDWHRLGDGDSEAGRRAGVHDLLRRAQAELGARHPDRDRRPARGPLGTVKAVAFRGLRRLAAILGTAG